MTDTLDEIQSFMVAKSVVRDSKNAGHSELIIAILKSNVSMVCALVHNNACRGPGDIALKTAWNVANSHRCKKYKADLIYDLLFDTSEAHLSFRYQQ